MARDGTVGHTEGPWKVFKGDPQSRPGIDADSSTIVMYGTDRDDGGVYGDTPEEAAANARLIAAAPEMYEALKAVSEFEASPDFSRWAKVVDNARAALSKAAPRAGEAV